jgi:tRNA threonylcarbamoyladenosine biosynthesis protein TsaB
MSLVLCIETSVTPYGVVLASKGEVVYNSLTVAVVNQDKDVAAIVQEAFWSTGLKPARLTKIAINCGPGGTSSIRTGVAFANSLAYSLNIPVAGFNTFELLGIAGWQQFQCPVISTVKSIKGNAYVGLFSDGKISATRYGQMAATVAEMTVGLTEFAVAGAHREAIRKMFPERTVHDTGQKFGLATAMLDMPDLLAQRGLLYPAFFRPITEESSLFSEE